MFNYDRGNRNMSNQKNTITLGKFFEEEEEESKRAYHAELNHVIETGKIKEETRVEFMKWWDDMFRGNK